MTRSRRRRRLGLVGLLALAAMFIAACGDSGKELNTFDPQGENARNIDKLIVPVFGIAGVVLVIVFALTLYMVRKFRASAYPEDEFPVQLHGHMKAELGWTIVPALILAGVAVFSVSYYAKLNDYHKKDALDVVVVGNQWWWEYRYYFNGFDHDTDYDPDIDPSIYGGTYEGRTEKHPDIITATQLVIPADREIDLTITSRDVIHSFWIPKLNGKRDAVPGRMAPWKLEADDPGVYFGQCTEFCGLSHSRMRMQVVAMTADDFQSWVDTVSQGAKAPTPASQAWLDQQRDPNFDAIPDDEKLDSPTATAAERGLATFRAQCTRCHEVFGVNDDIYTGAQQVSGAAPNLTFFANRTTYAGGIFNLYNADGTLNRPQLEAWLRNAPSQKAMAPNLDDATKSRGMPNLGLDEATIDDLVEFLQTLGPKPSEAVIQATEVE
jgi:cytochrome c oxidase subunit 2